MDLKDLTAENSDKVCGEVAGKASRTTKCFRCDGTGLICDACGETESVCACELEGLDVRTFSDCEDCKGSGR